MLKSKNTLFIGTMKKNKRENAESLKSKRIGPFLSTINEYDNVTLTINEDKRNTSMFLLSSLHSTVKIEHTAKI